MKGSVKPWWGWILLFDIYVILFYQFPLMFRSSDGSGILYFLLHVLIYCVFFLIFIYKKETIIENEKKKILEIQENEKRMQKLKYEKEREEERKKEELRKQSLDYCEYSYVRIPCIWCGQYYELYSKYYINTGKRETSNVYGLCCSKKCFTENEASKK